MKRKNILCFRRLISAILSISTRNKAMRVERKEKEYEEKNGCIDNGSSACILSNCMWI